MTGARLEVSRIGKSFRGLRAVHDVSFDVPAGAIYGLIGPNGAGKTTIFNMIAGVYRPDSGTIRLDGKSIATVDVELKIAMDIAGGLAVVHRARLTGFRSARCTVSGSLAMQQTVITKRQRQFDLPGAIRLRQGVALLAADEIGPRVEHAVVQTVVSRPTPGMSLRADAAV